MIITQVTRNYRHCDGQYTVEQATVPVAIGRETRDVLIERLSPGHCWFAVNDRVVVRFRTGKKEHVCRPTIHQRGSRFFPDVQGFRNRNSCVVTRWATDGETGSGWTH